MVMVSSPIWLKKVSYRVTMLDFTPEEDEDQQSFRVNPPELKDG